LIQVQELTHLPVQARIGEGIRCQLVTEEIFDDVFRVGNRVEHFRHFGPAGIPVLPILTVLVIPS
jgi:hypothetical protein